MRFTRGGSFGLSILKAAPLGPSMKSMETPLARSAEARATWTSTPLARTSMSSATRGPKCRSQLKSGSISRRSTSSPASTDAFSKAPAAAFEIVSTGTTLAFAGATPASRVFNSPEACSSLTMSQPPTNSPFTYS